MLLCLGVPNTAIYYQSWRGVNRLLDSAAQTLSTANRKTTAESSVGKPAQAETFTWMRGLMAMSIATARRDLFRRAQCTRLEGRTHMNSAKMVVVNDRVFRKLSPRRICV